MKFKTFILTFIMIMSSPFLFGHQNISNYDWDNVASLQDNAKMSTQFQSDDNTRSGNEIVAKIGEDGYATLQGAVDAATEGQTVTVIDNIEVENTVTVAAGKVITLDLNGKTISMVYNTTVTANHTLISNSGNLTIKSDVEGGKLSYEYKGDDLGTSYSANTVTSNPGSVLTVVSGTIENLTYDKATIAYAIDGLTNGGAGDVTVNIKGGVITSKRQAVRIFANSTTKTGTLNIEGGELTGRVIVQNSNANANKAVLDVTGGIFNPNDYKTDVLFVGGSNSATIDIEANVKGGTFNGEITDTSVTGFIYGGTFNSDVSEYCAEGYEIVQNADGTYGVVQEDAVAQIVGGQGYATLQDAINAATEGQTVTVIANIELEKTVTVAAGKVVTLDLNGNVVSGVCNSSEAHLFMVQNTAELTVKDSSENQEGKITYARGTSGTGWAIDLEGELVLESGTIELTGESWSIGYVVDIRPNSWGTEYTEATTFTMNGGKLVSSFDAIRIASSSADGSQASGAVHENVSANFVMNDGEIVSNRDAIFVQQSNTVYDILNLQVNDGKISGAQSLIRLYGPAATSVVNNVENPITLDINGGTFDYTGNNLEDTRWLVPGVIMVAGGATFDQMLDYTNFEITGGTFDGDVNDYCADGYTCVYDVETSTYGVVQEDAVAQIVGGQSYTTLQDAINAVEDNQTIKLLCDNNENIVAGNENQKPFNKIFTIDGNNFNVTGKWHFGRDDHNQDNSEITVINTNFSVNGIKINDFKSVTIDECTFKNITEGNGIYVAADEFTSSIVVTNCEIENVAGAGINFRNPVNATITGNTIKNTGNNAITFQHGTYQEAETGTYTIINNVFENWANNATEGRAIRIAVGEAPRFMIIEENAMIKTNAPEEFVKITGNTDNVSIDKNYWNGANPIDEHTPAYYLIEGVTPNDYYQDYSVENGLQNLLPTQTPVAQIVGGQSYTTLQDAINAVEYGQTIVMIDDTELETNITISSDKVFNLNLNGKKITYTSTTQNEAMITNKGNLTIMDEVNDKDEMGEIYYNYVGPADNTHGKGNYTISNAGTLGVKGGKIHIAKLSGHAKYPIDNNSTSGDAILVIDGGHLYNYNTCAIRQFCNSTTYQNSVTINGGLIEGYCAIWMQNPGKNEVNGQLIINNGEIKTTAKAFVEGTSPISEVSSKIYCTIDGEGGSWDAESKVRIIDGTINENVYLNNETPASITLHNEAHYNGYVEFELAEGIELHHNGLKNATITKTIEGTTEDGWYTIASPVGTVEHSVVDGLLTNDTHDLYRYDEPTQMWQNVKVAENNFTTLDAGRGYIYANTATTTLSFTGDLVAESVEQEISASGSELKGFNLIGNPFTHNIKLENISGAQLAEGFYTLTKEGAWNAKTDNDAIISAGQGALIKTIETKTVQINPTAASKSRGVNNGQLKIKVANSKYNDVAYVSFNKGIGLDKINHRNADIPMVFVPVNGTNYAVAVMSNDVTEIPVSFVAKTMGEYTIGVEAQDCEFAQMTLIDKMTGYSTNLLLEDYTFIATSKDNADRFIIRLMSSFDHSFGVDNFVIFSNNEMIINDIQGEGVIRIVDVLGRPVAEYNVFGSANISTTSFRSGVYMIQVIDDNGVKVQKIIID